MVLGSWFAKPGLFLDQLAVEPGCDGALFRDLFVFVSPRCPVTNVIDLPLAWWAGMEMGGGLLWAWIAMSGDVTVRTVLLMWRYRRGAWVQTEV